MQYTNCVCPRVWLAPNAFVTFELLCHCLLVSVLCVIVSLALNQALSSSCIPLSDDSLFLLPIFNLNLSFFVVVIFSPQALSQKMSILTSNLRIYIYLVENIVIVYHFL